MQKEKQGPKNVNPVSMSRIFVALVCMLVRIAQLKFKTMKMFFIAQIVINLVHLKCKMQLKNYDSFDVQGALTETDDPLEMQNATKGT